MTIQRKPLPELGSKFRLPELDATAGAVAIITEAPGALMDGWRAIFMDSEKAAPETVKSGGFYVVRTKDGRNVVMRIYRAGQTFMLLSGAGALEENVELEWVAPVRLVVPV